MTATGTVRNGAGGQSNFSSYDLTSVTIPVTITFDVNGTLSQRPAAG